MKLEVAMSNTRICSHCMWEQKLATAELSEDSQISENLPMLMKTNGASKLSFSVNIFLMKNLDSISL